MTIQNRIEQPQRVMEDDHEQDGILDFILDS